MSSQRDWYQKRILRNPEIRVKSLPQSEGIEPQQFELSQAAPSPHRLQYYTEPLQTAVPEDPDPYAKLLEFWHLLQQNKITIAAMIIVGVLAGLVYSLCLLPRYEARASIDIQSSQDTLRALSLTTASDTSIQTQIDILKSPTFLKRVESKIKPKEYAEPPGSQDFLSSWRKALGVQSKKGMEAWQEAAWMAHDTLDIKFARDSSITMLKCASTDPQVAADFINTIAKEYIQRGAEERWETYQNTSKWLNQAQEELKIKLEASEDALQQFARKSGLLFTSETQNVAEEKLTQLQTTLSKVQGERIVKQSQYEASNSSRPEALPEVLDSGPIGGYQVQLADLRRQLADLSSSLTPEHYKIKRLQAQIRELESISERERGNIIKRIKNEYEAALRTENQIRSEYDRQARQLSGQAEDIIHYKTLQREAETNRQLYMLTLEKGKEASIASAMHASAARVIDLAGVPITPYKPDPIMNFAVGLMGGLLFGAAFVFVRERLHATVHLSGDLLLQSGMRELGVIPSGKIDRLGHTPVRLRITGASKSSVPLPARNMLYNPKFQEAHKQQLELVTWNNKPSRMAEAFRTVMASILFSANSETGHPQTIVVTSPTPKIGKTTIVCNLGIALAEINHRVLLIDGDMRIPRLHNIFCVANGWGLSNLLLEKTPIEEYSLEQLGYKTEIPNLWVLPSGSARTGLSGLLYSPRLPELLARSRHEFDVILVDAPPVLNVVDARVLGRAADSVVLVFRASSTTSDEAVAAMKCFDEDGTPILGTILNDWNPKIAGYGSYRSPYSYQYDPS
jgi:polysaccharide biosynthesis transport protein